MVPSTFFELFGHLQKYKMAQLVFFSVSQLGKVGLPLLTHLHNTAGREGKGQEKAFFFLSLLFLIFSPLATPKEKAKGTHSHFPEQESQNVFVGVNKIICSREKGLFLSLPGR